MYDLRNAATHFSKWREPSSSKNMDSPSDSGDENDNNEPLESNGSTFDSDEEEDSLVLAVVDANCAQFDEDIVSTQAAAEDVDQDHESNEVVSYTRPRSDSDEFLYSSMTEVP